MMPTNVAARMTLAADPDSLQGAVAAGARLVQTVSDKFYGDRSGTIEDPLGHKWHISTHVEDVPPDELARRAAAAMKPS